MDRSRQIYERDFATDIAYPEDRVLAQPPEADSWNDIRRNVIIRARIASVGQATAEDLMVLTDEITTAIDGELARR